MQSKTSYFNKVLFLSNIKRFWPLWVIASLGGLMIPVLTISSGRNLGLTTRDGLRVYYLGYAIDVAPIIMFIYAILVAMAVWSYLYQTRSVNQLHSMPITREGLFFTNFASGLAIIYIPFVIAGLFEVIITTALLGFVGKEILTAVLFTLIDGLFFFSFATIIAHITGNVLALPVFYIIFNFLVMGFEYVIKILIAGFVPGFYAYGGMATTNFSPIVGLYTNIDLKYSMNYEYADYNNSFGTFGTPVYSSIKVEHYNAIWIYLAVAVLFTFIALFIYKKSESENASNIIAFKPLRRPILYIYTVGCAISGGELLYSILSSFRANYYRALSLIVLCIVVEIVAYYVGLMLLNKSTRVFNKRSFIEISSIAALLILMIVTLKADLFGIFSKVPAKSDIESVSVQIANAETSLVSGVDDELIDEIIHAHQALIDDKDVWFSYEDKNVYDFNEDEETINNAFTVKYKLKDNTELYRRYVIPINKARVNQENTYDYMICKLYASPDYIIKKFDIDPEFPEIEYINLYPINREFISITGSNAVNFIECMKNDIKDNEIGKNDLYDYLCGYDRYSGVMAEICYSGEDEYKRSWGDYYIKPNMKNTVDFCEKNGWLTRAEIELAMAGDKFAEDYVYYK